MTKPALQIIRDSREQNGYSFEQFPDVVAITGTLTTGDYSLAGFTDKVAIERKELSDLLGCLTHDRERFTRELERLRGFASAAIIVEAPLIIIEQGRYRSRMPAQSAIQSIISIMANYRMPFYFAQDSRAGERFVIDFLRHYQRHELERYKAIFQKKSQ